MCSYDSKTGSKLFDCDDCGCENSTKAGNHDPRPTGTTVKIGNQEVPLYKCKGCGAYIT